MEIMYKETGGTRRKDNWDDNDKEWSGNNMRFIFFLDKTKSKR